VSAVVLLGLGLLGGAGAVLRFALDGAVAARHGRRLPLGTLAVNLSGSLALGILVGAAVSGDAQRLAGTGLIGAFTTFSTWAFETHRLAEDGQLRAATANVVVSLVLGLLAAWAGRAIGGAW
jgi:CrcB protein